MQSFRPFRSARIHWSVLAFLVGFTILVIIISFYYLKPAMEAAHGATEAQKRGLAAYSRLLLAVVLLILISGLLLTVRIGRFFFPRPTAPWTRTRYVDAWAESAKRIEVPPEDDQSLD